LSSCCLRSEHQPAKRASWLPLNVCRHARASLQAMPDASLKPDAIPCPPTADDQYVYCSENPGIYSHGGITCAESPHRMTRPIAHRLQLLAEKVKGLERRTWIQSSGNWTGSFRLFPLDVSILQMNRDTRDAMAPTHKGGLDELCTEI